MRARAKKAWKMYKRVDSASVLSITSSENSKNVLCLIYPGMTQDRLHSNMFSLFCNSLVIGIVFINFVQYSAWVVHGQSCFLRRWWPVSHALDNSILPCRCVYLERDFASIEGEESFRALYYLS